MMCNGAISWGARRQNIVTTSTTQAEYYASNHAGKEGIWLRSLLFSLRPFTSPSIPVGTPMPPTRLWADNQSSITVTRNPKYHQRTKHWDISYHWIRKQYNKLQTLDVAYIST